MHVNQYRFTVENSGNAEVSKKNKVKINFYLTPYYINKFPAQSISLQACAHRHTYTVRVLGKEQKLIQLDFEDNEMEKELFIDLKEPMRDAGILRD